MADNPIKYNDFVQPDGSVTQLIGQLEQLQTTYAEMLSKIKADALKTEEAIQKVSGATDSGRKATKKAATDADRLGKAYNDLSKSQSDTAKEIAALKAQQQQQNQLNKLTAKLNSSLAGSYNRLSAQYSLNKIKLNALSKAEREGTKAGKALEKQTKDIYEEMNRLQKATGKHTLQVGNYGIATQNLHPLLGRINHGLGAMGTNLEALGKADKPFKILGNAVVNFGKATLTFLLSPIGLVLSALGALFYLIVRNKDTVIQFNDALVNVGKTANISGEELRGLGEDIVNLSRKLKVIRTPALLEYATVAGQLGVKGRDNILAFTESLAKLETATNISGQEGASNIARLLTLTDGGVQNVKDFGDEIVNLGNNFAATENEILTNATAIAQNVAQYNIGRKAILAYATATKAVGLEAELTGSTIGRTLGLIEKAIRTGKGIDEVAKLTGVNVENLKKQFKEDPGAVFNNFIAGLNSVNVAGGSVNGQLENIGITSIRDQRVISSLATKGFDVLKGSIEEVNRASGSLDKEFGAASGKLGAQLSRVGIAWDNLILTIEDGEGFLSKIAAFFSGEFAKSIDRAAFGIKVFGAVISGFGGYIKEVVTIFIEFFNSLRGFADINFDLKDPIGTLKSFKDAVLNVKGLNIKDNFKRVGSAFTDAFKEELFRSTAATKEAMEKLTKEAMEKLGEVVDSELDASIKKSIKTVGQIDEAISALNAKLKGTSSREQAKTIQDEIKALEAKRNAILGVASANLQEAESRASKKAKLKVDVMDEGKAKDIALLEIELQEKRKLWQKYGLDVVLLENYEKTQRAAISEKHRKEQEAKDKAAKDKDAKNKKETYDNAVKIVEQEFDLRMSEIDIMKTTEAEKTRLRLEAEKARLKKILELNAGAESTLSKLQIDTIKNTIKKIDQQMQEVGNKDYDIYSLVGINLNDEQKQAISESVSFAVDNIKSILAARVEAADIALQKAQEETQASQTKLDQEIEARNNGYASSVLSAQRELELNRKKEQQALKDKEKAQKAQEAIDTVQQVSGLITASVQIWKALAGIPIIGPALAATAVGVMFASYAASKIKAKSVAKEKLEHGGFEFLEGGSHASGNDIPIGTTRGGKQRTAEGGEALAVINKRNTRKYRSIIPNIINSLNKGTFEKSFANSFIPSGDLPGDVFVNSGFDSPDLKNIEKDLSEIRKRGERQRYTDSQGRLVEVYKNVKTTYV